jgi:hypothetical protein
MVYKVYKDTGPAASMCGLVVPDDGRDTEAEARKLYGETFKFHETIDDVTGFDEQPDMPGCYSCYFWCYGSY